jgi:hypothetical protein
LRRAARLPLAGAAYARAKTEKLIKAVIAARTPAQNEPPPTDDELSAVRDIRSERSPGLTVAQQRALLRMKSARLSIAQRRRCSPASIVPDVALREVALANSASPATICEAFAQHQIRDESLAVAFAEVLQREFNNV